MRDWCLTPVECCLSPSEWMENHIEWTKTSNEWTENQVERTKTSSEWTENNLNIQLIKKRLYSPIWLIESLQIDMKFVLFSTT